MVRRYSDNINQAQQPYVDLFLNLSIETEQEMDFDDEGVVDLTVYDEEYEWTEEQYLCLRFKALRHVASQEYHNDAYSYLVRTRPDELENCRQVYDENYHEWLNMKSRLGELQSQVEAVLEAQVRAP